MSYLVRRITVSYWPDGENCILENIDNLSADAITNDLKTTDNKLSLWEIENLNQLEDVALAIATTRNEKKDFLIVAINKEDIELDFDLEKDNLGDTAYTKYKESHYDLMQLTLFNLKKFAKKIVDTLKKQQFTYNFIFYENKSKLVALYTSGALDESTLKKKDKLYKLCTQNN